MPWTEVHWRSEVMLKQTTMQVLLPRVGRPPFPVFYLLHGLSDDSTVWLRHTRLEWYLRDWPMTVVLPDGYRGFYTDNREGPAFARHLGVELVDFVDRNFRTRAERAGRAIGGLSMGGYGALRVGLGWPDRFCSINSHSGALGRANADFSEEAVKAGRHPDKPPEFIAELRRVFGERPLGTAHDILELAVAAKKSRRLPKLLIDCGRKDYLRADSREFHRELTRARIPHRYCEFAGAHDWDYWDAHIGEAIAFHARNLGVKRA
ncbi:MAG TPA: alpha/beta hydrolase-fold protein [Candidatus Didemnitutus sp.]|jgi:S-formylglutathione hydrolase FrmB